jgi:uncharacterized protein
MIEFQMVGIILSSGRIRKAPLMYQRHAKPKIQEALVDTRVVLISGPRQSGKTTRAMDIAADEMPFFTLHDPSVFAAASDDPVGFLRGPNFGTAD